MDEPFPTDPSQGSDSQRCTCDLCDLRLTKHVVTADVSGMVRRFCCAGCRQVFLILHDSGLLDGDYRNSELYRTSLRLGLIRNLEEDTPPLKEISPEEIKQARELSLHIDGMWCSACAWLIEKVVGSEKAYCRHR